MLNRAGRFKLSGRFLSSPAITLSDSIQVVHSSIPTEQTGRKTLQNLLSKAPSIEYLHSIAHPTFTPSKEVVVNDQASSIKEQIQRLVETEKYDTLLDFLLHWARANTESMVLTETLSKEELSQLVSKIIRYQISTLHDFTLNSPIKKSHNGVKLTGKLENIYTDVNYVKSRATLSKLRQFFSSLLYTDKQEFIYHHQKRDDLYTSYSATGYKLTVNDYENLIYLELSNLKYDLASKWFQHFSRQFPKNHEELMTYNMWMMKFQVYSGGSPSHWTISETELSSETYYRPIKSFFNNEIPFSNMFNDFLMSYKNLGKKLVLNNDFNETLVYSIGYSKNVDYLNKFIESRYGIDVEGNLSPRFKKLDISDPSYPTVRIVKAAFVALSFNSKFNDGLKIINSFQRHYDIILSDPKARTFWEQVFRWCNITTKFDEKKTLPHYLKQLGNSTTLLTLEEAKANVDFDYVGYLNFIADLKKQRVATFNSLWNLYLENNGYFSKYTFKMYLDFLKEELDENVEGSYFAYLELLSGEWKKYQTSPGSFNKRNDLQFRGVKDFDTAIYTVYMDMMKSILNHKWKDALAGQCQPIIEKWSLDGDMRLELEEWFEEVGLPQYKEMMETKREEFMISLRTEEKDSFLDIL